MTVIRLQYWHNGQPYKLTDGLFNKEEILSYAKGLQETYKPFADSINSEGGYMEVTLSANPKSKNGICFEPQLSAISQDLKSEIEKAIASR